MTCCTVFNPTSPHLLAHPPLKYVLAHIVRLRIAPRRLSSSSSSSCCLTYICPLLCWKLAQRKYILDFTIGNKRKDMGEQVHTSCPKPDNHLCFSGTSVCEKCSESVKTTKQPNRRFQASPLISFPVPLISWWGFGWKLFIFSGVQTGASWSANKRLCFYLGAPH